jgi:hypothetical protein
MRNICVFASLTAFLALFAVLFIPAPPAQAQTLGEGEVGLRNMSAKAGITCET